MGYSIRVKETNRMLITPDNTSYFVYTNVWDCFDSFIGDDDCVEEGEYETMKEVIVNENHFFRGYFFYNDMDDFEDKKEHYPMCCNTEEELDTYHDCNNSHGHLQCTYIEEVVNGVVVKTTDVDNKS